MSRLESNHYGKHAVRLLRVHRTATHHEVAEWSADVLIEGDLAGSYLSDDNTSVVPTDTVKNTILALAHDHEAADRDEFALLLARHFPVRYAHLTACDAEVTESLWSRLTHDGQPHPHCFTREANGQPFSRVRYERGGAVRRSAGLRGFVLMKTTASGFAEFPRCEMTTLPETSDRILATSLDAVWEFADGATAAPADAAVRDAILAVFADTWSPSVQRTLFLMAEAALAAVPGLSRITLTLPNKHYLPLDLTKVGRPAGQDRVFLPTDDPFGFIEATVAR
jgi:urate oxidase